MDNSLDLSVKFGILIINQNNKSGLKQTLLSLAQGPVEIMQVFVLDNNCSPSQKSKRVAEKQQLMIEREVVSETLTKSAAYNLLIDKARLAGCDWVWLIKSGSKIRIGSWKNVIRAIENSKVGIIGGGIKTRVGVEMGGGEVGWISFRIKRGLVKNNAKGKWIEAGWVWMDNLILRIKAIEKTGKMATNFFQGYEDMDMSMLVKRAGWQVKLWTGVMIEIKEKEQLTPLQVYFNGRNPWLIITRHFRGLRKWGKYCGYVIVNIPDNLMALAQMDRSRELIKSYLVGVVDGWNLVRAKS